MKITYEAEGIVVTVEIERLSPTATEVIRQLSRLLMPTLPEPDTETEEH